MSQELSRDNRLAIAAPDQSLTIEELKHTQNQIHKLLKEVMQEGIDNDYAKIPGTQKMSLLKPGAEKICNLFRFVAIPRVEEFRDGDDFTFRVFVRIESSSGRFLGEGLGQASTAETKFAWRRASCRKEWDETDFRNRRIKYYESDETLQVRENPADKANNMLKIAKKRALIDAVLTVTGCSNLFTQDREDEAESSASPPRRPQSAKAPGKSAQSGEAQLPMADARELGLLWSRIHGTTPEAKADFNRFLREHFKVDSSLKIPASKKDAVFKAVQESGKGAQPAASAPAPAGDAKSDAPLPEQTPDQKVVFELFGILGIDLIRQAELVKGANGDWAGLAKKLEEELPEEKG